MDIEESIVRAIIDRPLFYLSILLGIVGAIVAFGTLNRYFNLVDAQKWSQIQGVITQSEVYRDTRKNPGNDKLVTVFGLRISYEYIVDGEIYIGHNFSYAKRFREYDDSQEAKAEAKRYPVGQQMTVYYYPNKPANAALDIAVPNASSVTITVIVGVILIVVGVVLFFVSRSR